MSSQKKWTDNGCLTLTGYSWVDDDGIEYATEEEYYEIQKEKDDEGSDPDPDELSSNK